MTRYRLASHVLRAPVGDEEVLLDTRSEMYHHVGGSGRVIIQGLEQGLSPAEISDQIASDTGEAVQRVAADLNRFVASMIDLGLLEDDA